MNKLIIIGNGFDLRHGLPTSYGSFIKWLIKQNLEKVLEDEQCDNDLFEITKENLHEPDLSINQLSLDESVERLLLNHTNKQDTVITKAFKRLKCSFSPNGTFATQIIENMRTRQWVDIEMEYFRQLTVILKNYNQENHAKDKATYDLDTLNRNLTYLTDKLRDYLNEVAGKKTANEHFGDIAGDPIPFR